MKKKKQQQQKHDMKIVLHFKVFIILTSNLVICF